MRSSVFTWGQIEYCVLHILNGVSLNQLSEKSASMLSVGQYAILNLFLIFFFYKRSIWHWCGVSVYCWTAIHFPTLNLYFSCLDLWWVGTNTPFSARKRNVHRTCPIASSMPTSSVSVEIFVISFSLHDDVSVVTLPIVMHMPMWLFMSGCTEYELSSHHCGLSFSSIFSVSSLMPLMYWIMLVSFLLSCSLGCFTYVHKKAVVVWM